MELAGNVSRSTNLIDSTTVAIILAGGSSSRVGAVGRILPKCMLPVSASETLITRLLSQLLRAGLRHIIVSTSELHYDILQVFIDRYGKEVEAAREVDAFHLFKNKSHVFGPVPALANAITAFPARSYLLCLSDILFVRDPFSQDHSDGSEEEVVLYSRYYEPSQGGVIMSADSSVIGLSYLPVGDKHKYTSDIKLLNWTGAAFFQGAAIKTIENSGLTLRNRPLEALLTRLIVDGHSMTTRNAGRFFNINDLWEYCKVISSENIE